MGEGLHLGGEGRDGDALLHLTQQLRAGAFGMASSRSHVRELHPVLVHRLSLERRTREDLSLGSVQFNWTGFSSYCLGFK